MIGWKTWVDQWCTKEVFKSRRLTWILLIKLCLLSPSYLVVPTTEEIHDTAQFQRIRILPATSGEQVKLREMSVSILIVKNLSERGLIALPIHGASPLRCSRVP